MRVSTSVVLLPGRPLGEIPTKNRRVRMLAVDDLTASVLRAQIQMVEERASAAGVELIADPYVFADAADGSEPWKPDAVSRYFARLRARIGLVHLDFHYLRKFMETYGQEMGYSVAQVAMRAGHDPTVAAKHYRGRVAETDRALAKGGGVATRAARQLGHSGWFTPMTSWYHGAMAKNLTIRLDDDLAKDTEALARAEGQSLNETIKLALREAVAQRKKDPAFKRRLRQIIEEDRELLERLAK